MIHKMEPPPNEVSVGSETLTNQQSGRRKLFSDEQRDEFARFFFTFNKRFGSTGWAITVFYVLFTSFTIPSRTCPDLPNFMYEKVFLFDMHAFVSKSETNFDHERDLIWSKRILRYGYLKEAFIMNTNVSISKVGQMYWRLSFIIFFET